VISFLANALWQPFLLAAAVLVIDATCRRSAANVRYWIAIAALCGAVAMPIVSAIPRGGTTSGKFTLVEPDLTARMATMIVTTYFAIVAIAALRLVRRWRNARRLTSDTISTPVTIGVFRPTILVPRFLTDPDLVAAAIAHETAHIRRRDYLVHLAIEIVSLPLAFHPAIVLLRRRIGELREMACDAIAASDRPGYARALVAIASLARTHAPAGALAMATTSIERRIASLRGKSHRLLTLVAPVVFAIVASLLFVAGCRNAAHPVVGVNLSGHWTLDRSASRLGRLQPYRAFETTIIHQGDHLSVKQTRTLHSNAQQHVAWSVITDGVERPFAAVPMARGTARWEDHHLVLDMHAPDHTEHAAAYIENEELVIEGGVHRRRGDDSYRVVFRRQP